MMFPITEDKSLLGILGKPLLEHQIATAREASPVHFVIMGNPDNTANVNQMRSRIPGIEVDLALREESPGIADPFQKRSNTSARAVSGAVNSNDVFSTWACRKISTEAEMAAASSIMLGYQVREYSPIRCHDGPR